MNSKNLTWTRGACYLLGALMLNTTAGIVVRDCGNQNMREEVLSKADSLGDENGSVSVDEALQVYQILGCDGEEIYSKLESEKKQIAILKGAQKAGDIRLKESMFLALEDSFNNLGENEKDYISKAARAFSDKDVNGEISVEEAKYVFKLAYQNDSVKDLRLDLGKLPITMVVWPWQSQEDAEIVRFLNINIESYQPNTSLSATEYNF